jgi:hypothetical protein
MAGHEGDWVVTGAALGHALFWTSLAIMVMASLRGLFVRESEEELLLRAIAWAVQVASGIVTGDAFWAGFSALMLGWAVWDWWRRRKKRRRRLTSIGEKTRALIAGMVERMRESAEPTPQKA